MTARVRLVLVARSTARGIRYGARLCPTTAIESERPIRDTVMSGMESPTGIDLLDPFCAAGIRKLTALRGKPLEYAPGLIDENCCPRMQNGGVRLPTAVAISEGALGRIETLVEQDVHHLPPVQSVPGRRIVGRGAPVRADLHWVLFVRGTTLCK